MTDAEQVFPLRTAARIYSRIVPIWLTVFTLILLVMSGQMAVAAWLDDAATAPRPAVALVFIGVWAMVAIFWKIHSATVREVRRCPDGSLVITTVLGRNTTVRPGGLTGVREQLFVPGAGSIRARTQDGRTFYFVAPGEKPELVDLLEGFQR